MRPAFPGAFPALVAVLFATWAGSYHLGASAAGAAIGHLVLLGAAVWTLTTGDRWWDPLRLGPTGALVLWALGASVALAWWLSPVPRAGRVGVALLPAVLLLPAGVARLWRGAAARRAGARALSGAVGGIGAWSLGRWLAGAGDLPALPLGHHLFLVVWLVALAPLAAAPAWLRGDGDPGAGWRLLAGGAGVLAALAILATRTLIGVAALAVEAAVLLAPAVGRTPGARRTRRLAAAAVAGLALAAALAFASALAAGDPSLRVRPVYWRAGWEGVSARPLSGQGPGSTAWTVAEFLRPVPGLNPPNELVGDLHLLPLTLAYELGLPALALAVGVAVVFAVRRRRELGRLEDPELAAFVRAGLAGLAGVLVCGLGVGDWRVAAWPVAAAVAAGAALLGSAGAQPAQAAVAPRRRSAAGGLGRRISALRRAPVRRRWVICLLYVLVAAALLVPANLAHWRYERGEVERAVALDPDFPLYRFRAAQAEWLVAGAEGERARDPVRSALGALEAAEAGHGVAALWLRAGAAAHAAGLDAVAAPAFERVCALDPLSPMAPLALLAVGSPLHRPEALGARALAAEPRLAAALLWEERPELFRRVLASLAAAEGLDPGWREEMLRRARSLPRGTGQMSRIAVVLDAPPASDRSFSLQVFRRLPRRMELLSVPVREAGARRMARLPPATTRTKTDPLLFPPTCFGPFAPQPLRKTLWKTL